MSIQKLNCYEICDKNQKLFQPFIEQLSVAWMEFAKRGLDESFPKEKAQGGKGKIVKKVEIMRQKNEFLCRI
jgi:hypothetical protein